MRKEAVPVIRPSKRVPRPIGFLGVAEDDARSCIGLVVITPHIPVAGIGCRLALACAPEPGMLVGSMIDDELSEHSQLSPSGLLHEAAEIRHRAEIGIDRAVVRNVVAVVTA